MTRSGHQPMTGREGGVRGGASLSSATGERRREATMGGKEKEESGGRATRSAIAPWQSSSTTGRELLTARQIWRVVQRWWLGGEEGRAWLGGEEGGGGRNRRLERERLAIMRLERGEVSVGKKSRR